MQAPDTGPTFCRPCAYEALEHALPTLETVDGFVDSVLAVAMHSLEDLDAEEIKKGLDSLAESILARIQSREPEALLAHLHVVLFEHEGFAGDLDDFHHPKNGLLPCVLQSRRGMPILLSLVYYLIGARIGLQICGVNSPWHFLSSVTMRQSTVYIDPFFGGRLMSREEALDCLTRARGEPIPESYGDPLRATSHREWLLRIVRNLEHSFSRHESYEDLAAMIELRQLIERGSSTTSAA